MKKIFFTMLLLFISLFITSQALAANTFYYSKSEIQDFLYDSENNQLVAVAKNHLIFIDPEDLSLKHEINLHTDTKWNDFVIDHGDVYVAIHGNQILQVDLNTYEQKGIHQLQEDVIEFDVVGTKIYYLNSQGDSLKRDERIRVFDRTSQTDQVLFSLGGYTYDLIIDDSTNVMYIQMEEKNDTFIQSFNLNDSSLISTSDSYRLEQNLSHLDDTFLYTSRGKYDKNDLMNITYHSDDDRFLYYSNIVPLDENTYFKIENHGLVKYVFNGSEFVIEKEAPVQTYTDIQPLDNYLLTDIDGHWAYENLDQFVSANLLVGYENADGSFSAKPNRTITRAEFVALLVRGLALNTEEIDEEFSDVSSKDWFYEPIRIASALDIANGFDGNEFRPKKEITRAEIAAMISRSFSNTILFTGNEKPFKDVAGHWAIEPITNTSKAGIIGGYPDGKFGPDNNATRAEAISMLTRALNKQYTVLPYDHELTNVVIKEHIQTEQYLNHTDYETVASIIETTTTGYYKTSAVYSLGTFAGLAQEGIQFKMNSQGIFAEVVSKSNSFAVVKVVNPNPYTQFMITNLDGKMEYINEDLSGLYYLKRSSDSNDWKIYNVIYNN
ncbi:S-layer homology domain-containing protein [Anaerobacillus sp. MEB173]|uniref:S-layer homology domain-containing protein n=1 Tax=Anaerobacillus sp. MEB173 TaxID=3383345 RepID=UPI003F901AD6